MMKLSFSLDSFVEKWNFEGENIKSPADFADCCRVKWIQRLTFNGCNLSVENSID